MRPQQNYDLPLQCRSGGRKQDIVRSFLAHSHGKKAEALRQSNRKLCHVDSHKFYAHLTGPFLRCADICDSSKQSNILVLFVGMLLICCCRVISGTAGRALKVARSIVVAEWRKESRSRDVVCGFFLVASRCLPINILTPSQVPRALRAVQ